MEKNNDVLIEEMGSQELEAGIDGIYHLIPIIRSLVAPTINVVFYRIHLRV